MIVLRTLKCQLLKMLQSASFLKRYCYCLCKLQKCEFVKTVKLYACVLCLFYRYVCRRVVFLYKWHRHLLAWHEYSIFVICTDPCEQGSFWQCCRLNTKPKIQRKKFSIFSTWHTLSEPKWLDPKTKYYQTFEHYNIHTIKLLGYIFNLANTK